MKKMLIELLTGAFLFTSVASFSGCEYPPIIEVEQHYDNHHHHRYYHPTEVVIYTSDCVSCHRTYHVHPPNPQRPPHPVIIYPG
jgi:hypothetical protein